MPGTRTRGDRMVTRVGALALAAGGVAWCVIRLLLLGEDPATEPYEDLNRAWTVVLAVLALGFLGMWPLLSMMQSRGVQVGLGVAVAGLSTTAVGSGVEFWAGSDAGFQLFGLGLVLFLGGTAVLGVAAVRSGRLPRWLSLFLASSGLLAFLGSIAGVPTLPFGVGFGLGCAAVGSWLWNVRHI